jgi:hypothetical protein
MARTVMPATAMAAAELRINLDFMNTSVGESDSPLLLYDLIVVAGLY